MAEQQGAPEAGLFTTLKALSSNLLAIVQTRLELLSTDVAEERERLMKLLVMVLIALFCLGVGVMLLFHGNYLPGIVCLIACPLALSGAVDVLRATRY